MSERRHRKERTNDIKTVGEANACTPELEPLLNAVTRFLNEFDFYYEPPEFIIAPGEHSYFRIDGSVRLDNGNYEFSVFGKETYRQITVYVNSPMAVPKKRRTAIAELVTRANFGLVTGNLEMDFADGELRYRSNLMLKNTPLTNALLEPLIFAALANMDMYQPAIEAVVMGDATPEEADHEIRRKEPEK